MDTGKLVVVVDVKIVVVVDAKFVVMVIGRPVDMKIVIVVEPDESVTKICRSETSRQTCLAGTRKTYDRSEVGKVLLILYSTGCPIKKTLRNVQ